MSIFKVLGGGNDEEENMSAFKKAGPAITIFIVAVLVRAVLEFYQAQHPGPTAVDFSWVTTFAAIAASWLGLGAGISNVLARLGKVERNTNGKSDEERTVIAKEAANHVISQLVTRDQDTGVPPIVQLSPVVPSADTETSSVDDR